MRRLRLLGLMLMAIFMLGAVAAGTASALEKEEPGLLPLEKTEFKVPVTLTGEGGVSTLTSGGSSIVCQKVVIEKGELGAGEPKHITLGTGRLNFSECKFAGGVACVSENTKGEKDLNEKILVTVDLHFVNMLQEIEKVKRLVPGVGIIILEPAGTIGSAKLNCGGVVIEVRGVVKGLILGVSLTADFTTGGSFHFLKVDDPCDTSDKLCEELAKKPFEAKTKKVFEAAEEEALVPFTIGEMALLDD